MATTKTPKQQLAETHYIPGRSLQDDVLDARRLGHPWKAIEERVNEHFKKNPVVTIEVSHESLRQWYGHLVSPAGRAAG